MNHKTLNALRFIAVLPLSAAAGWLAYVVFKISWQQMVPPYGFMSSTRIPIKTAIEFFASGVMGAAFSWAAFYITPFKKKFITYVCSAGAGGLSLISCGIALSQGNAVAIFMTLPLLVGLAWACYAISNAEISIESEGR